MCGRREWLEESAEEIGEAIAEDLPGDPADVREALPEDLEAVGSDTEDSDDGGYSVESLLSETPLESLFE